MIEFDRARCKSVILEPVDWRPPQKNELYLGKDNRVHRFKGSQTSRRAYPRLILVESQTTGATAK